MKTFKFSLVLRTRENIDAFTILDENINGIHSKRVNILYKKASLINIQTKYFLNNVSEDTHERTQSCRTALPRHAKKESQGPNKDK